MSNTYCPFIYHQIMIDFQNQASACCQFEASSSYEDYEKMMETYRKDMLAGEKIKPCRRCWEDEEKGFPSLRQSALTDFNRYSNHRGTMILDLRITNNCNLACTMCSEHSSTLWAKLKGLNHYFKLDSNLQNQLIENSKNLQKLSIQGGEPFYGNDFINFVDKLSNKSQIQLEIFSNTFTANIQILKKWATEFKQVMFISSADGTEKIFEDIRWPATWNKFEKKILEISKISNVGLNFNFTLQNLNILNLKDFIYWRNNLLPDINITISILEWPNYFHYSILTQDEISQAIKALDEIKNAKPHESEIIQKVKKDLESVQINHDLLIQKDIELKKIYEMRKNYMVRPERLELSTPSTSS